MSDDERNRLIRGCMLAGMSFLVMLMVFLYTSYKPDSQAVLALEFKNSMKKCGEEAGVGARAADKVAVLTPADKADLESHLNTQNTVVPENSVVLIMQEPEQLEPVFVFLKGDDETQSVCVNGIIEVITLNHFYEYLLEKYFPGSTIPAHREK